MIQATQNGRRFNWGVEIISKFPISVGIAFSKRAVTAEARRQQIKPQEKLGAQLNPSSSCPRERCLMPRSLHISHVENVYKKHRRAREETQQKITPVRNCLTHLAEKKCERGVSQLVTPLVT